MNTIINGWNKKEKKRRKKKKEKNSMEMKEGKKRDHLKEVAEFIGFEVG